MKLRLVLGLILIAIALLLTLFLVRPSYSDTLDRLVIPAIGVDAPVVAMTGNQSPDWVVGRYSYTEPGQAGIVVLGGHNVSLSGGAVFANLRWVPLESLVTIEHDGQEYAYSVSDVYPVPRTNEGWERIMFSLPDGEYELLRLVACLDWVPWYVVVDAERMRP